MPSGIGSVGFDTGLRFTKDVAVCGVTCVFGFDGAEELVTTRIGMGWNTPAFCAIIDSKCTGS